MLQPYLQAPGNWLWRAFLSPIASKSSRCTNTKAESYQSDDCPPPPIPPYLSPPPPCLFNNPGCPARPTLRAQRLLLGCHCRLIFNHLLGQSPFGMLERKCTPQLGWGQAAGEQCPPPSPLCLSRGWGWNASSQTGGERLQTKKTKKEWSLVPCQHFCGCKADMIHMPTPF